MAHDPYLDDNDLYSDSYHPLSLPESQGQWLRPVATDRSSLRESIHSSNSLSQLIDAYGSPDDQPTALPLKVARQPSASSSLYGSPPTLAPRGPRPLPSSPRIIETQASSPPKPAPPPSHAAPSNEFPAHEFDWFSSRSVTPLPSSSLSQSQPTRWATLSPQTPFNGTLHRNVSSTTAASLPTADELLDGKFNPSLLSHMANYLKAYVPRTEQTRGAIPYPNAFTATDVVNTLERALPDTAKSRSLALYIARSLHTQLFFFEVRDNMRPLVDDPDQVYIFAEEGHDEWEEVPTAVLTQLTSCYSPLCAHLTKYGIGGGGCLSPGCPNNLNSVLLKRQASTTGEDGPAPANDESAWAELVPPDLLGILGKAEITRQNQIHELINEERKFVRDIELLRTEFLEPLQDANPPIISPDELPAFISDVLLNAFDVRQQAANFMDALVQRQREQQPVIQNIGDLALVAALDWRDAYMHYYRQSPFADALVRREKVANPAFDAFLQAFTRRPNTRKLTFHSYHTRITFHLPRVILMLQGILKHTTEDNPDHADLKQAIDILQAQCKEMDASVAASEAIIECRKYNTDLIGSGGYLNDLDLLDDSRQLIMKGKMFRRPESTGFNDWVVLHVVLFDHYFIMTKPRQRGQETKYQIVRRVCPDCPFNELRECDTQPMPLELLTPLGFDEPPQPRSGRLHIRTALRNDEPSTFPVEGRDDRLLYPITFNYTGRHGGLFTLFVESASARKDWKAKLLSAIGERNALASQNAIFRLSTMSTGTFMPRGRYAEPAKHGSQFIPFGRPTCSVPFSTPEGHLLIAIGHEEGLWIGLRKDPASFRLVLHLKNITQCSVLQDYGLMLVLANKVLIAYPLEALVPSASTPREAKEPQRLSGSKDVLFFRVGKVGARLLVIYVKKDGVTQTVFKALEPVALADRGTKGFMRKKMEIFRDYKEFFIPSEVFGLLFLRSQLSIVCSKGFELMAIDKEPLRAVSFPDWSQLKGDQRAMDLQKRCNDSKAVGMYRISDQVHLFVFEDLAFYADKHGDPLKDRYNDVIDFQGTARTVAFLPPYLLAFDTNFIEIRHAASGKLCQILKGREMLCTYDGNAPLNRMPKEVEQRIHVVVQNESGSDNSSYKVAELETIEGRSELGRLDSFGSSMQSDGRSRSVLGFSM